VVVEEPNAARSGRHAAARRPPTHHTNNRAAPLLQPTSHNQSGPDDAPTLLIDWSEGALGGRDHPAAALAGCACALLPLAEEGEEGGGGGGSGDHHHPPSPTSPSVRPGQTRVFQLLQPCVRLACSPSCGAVSLADASSLDDTWVWQEAGGVGGGASAPASALSRLRAVRLCAAFPLGTSSSSSSSPQQEQQQHHNPHPRHPLPVRALSALLFLGLNAAASALTPPPPSSARP
jgi:hypothetical protein